jgi:hypothetical protein
MDEVAVSDAICPAATFAPAPISEYKRFIHREIDH